MSLKFAKEKIPADEKHFIADLQKRLSAKIRREYQKGVMRRDAHPKMHGLVRAYFIVEPDLPAELKVGLFAQVRRYKTWIRFSNQSSTVQPDSKRDIRGMAIKLMGVPGKKLLEAESDATTHDFILISTDRFVTANVREFADLIRAMTSGGWSVFWFFLTHWRAASNLWYSMLQHANPLHIHYHSTTPYLFGDRAVKYAVVPQVRHIDRIPSNPSDNYLRQAMVRQLSQEDAVFDFMVQFQTDPEKMPVEDPGVVWPEHLSKFRKLATIRIPRQYFDHPLQDEFGDELSFTPWHALPEHRPLGGINRARKMVYDTISALRHQHNHTQRAEPDSWDIPGMDPADQNGEGSRFLWGSTTVFRKHGQR